MEIELKLEFDPADRERLIACPVLSAQDRTASRLVATYFDTPRLDLEKAGYALRIRTDGSTWIQTVKAAPDIAAGLFVRGEWESKLGGDRPVLDAKAGPLNQLFDQALLETVAPQFTTDVERLGGPIERPDGSMIEYAVDSGEVRAGARFHPLSEIELELKHGSPDALFDLARMLNEQLPLRLGVQSKSARGYALAGNRATAAVKAQPIRLDRDVAVGDGFATIAAACIRQYRLNEDLLLRSGGAEPVHQARVAIRRLRSAFWLFRPLVEGDDEARMFEAELRWLAGELGEIRDIDVLLPELDGQQRTTLAAMREHRFLHLCNRLDTGRARRLPIELVEWLSTGKWRTDPANAEPRDRNLRGFACNRLEKLRKRIKRAGKDLAGVGDAQRHELRKDAKKLRYAAEFFVSLYPGRKPRRRIDRLFDRLETLQDKLGELNDRAGAPTLFARLGIDAALPPLAKKERKRLLDDAEDCFDAFVDCKRFWRD